MNYTSLPTGTLVGKPEKFTDSSNINSVLYLLAGRLLGNTNCTYLRTYVDKIYYKKSSLGNQSGFESETVCGLTSSATVPSGQGRAGGQSGVGGQSEVGGQQSTSTASRNFAIGIIGHRLSNNYITYSVNPPFTTYGSQTSAFPANPYVLQIFYSPTGVFTFDISNSYKNYDSLVSVNIQGRIVNLTKENSDRTHNGLTARRYTTSALTGYSTRFTSTGLQFTFYLNAPSERFSGTFEVLASGLSYTINENKGSISPNDNRILDITFYTQLVQRVSWRNTYKITTSGLTKTLSALEINGREYSLSADTGFFLPEEGWDTSVISNTLDRVSDSNLTNNYRLKFNDGTYLTLQGTFAKVIPPINVTFVGIGTGNNKFYNFFRYYSDGFNNRGSSNPSLSHNNMSQIQYFPSNYVSTSLRTRYVIDFNSANITKTPSKLEINGRDYDLSFLSNISSGTNSGHSYPAYKRYQTSAISVTADQVSDSNLTNDYRVKFTDGTILTIAQQAPTIQAPTISSFTADPTSITSGNSATLSWTITGNPTSVSIDNGVGSVTGQTSVSVSPTSTTTYTITATNSSGSVTETVTVTVTGSQPTPTSVASSRIDEIIFKGSNSRTLHYKYVNNAYVAQSNNINEYSSTVGTVSKALPSQITGVFIDNGEVFFESNQLNYLNDWDTLTIGSRSFYFGTVINHGSYYYQKLYSDALSTVPIINWNMLNFTGNIFKDNGDGIFLSDTPQISGTGKRITEFVYTKNRNNIRYIYDAVNERYNRSELVIESLISKPLTAISGGYSFTESSELNYLFREGNVIPLYVLDDSNNHIEFESTVATTTSRTGMISMAEFNASTAYPTYTRLQLSRPGAEELIGDYFAYKSDGSINKLITMFLGSVRDCTFIGMTNRVVYYKTEEIGNRSNFTARTVCGISSTASTGTSYAAKRLKEVIFWSGTGNRGNENRYVLNSGTDSYRVADSEISYTANITSLVRRPLLDGSDPPENTGQYSYLNFFLLESKYNAIQGSNTNSSRNVGPRTRYKVDEYRIVGVSSTPVKTTKLIVGNAGHVFWVKDESNPNNRFSLNESGGGILFIEYKAEGPKEFRPRLDGSSGFRYVNTVFRFSVWIVGDLLIRWLSLTRSNFSSTLNSNSLIFRFTNTVNNMEVHKDFTINLREWAYYYDTSNLQYTFSGLKNNPVHLFTESTDIPNFNFSNSKMTVYKNSINDANRLSLVDDNFAVIDEEASISSSSRNVNFKFQSFSKTFTGPAPETPEIPELSRIGTGTITTNFKVYLAGSNLSMLDGSNYTLNTQFDTYFDREIVYTSGEPYQGFLLNSSRALYRANTINIHTPLFTNVSDAIDSNTKLKPYSIRISSLSATAFNPSDTPKNITGTFVINNPNSRFNGIEIQYIISTMYFVDARSTFTNTSKRSSSIAGNASSFRARINFYYTGSDGNKYETVGPYDFRVNNDYTPYIDSTTNEVLLSHYPNEKHLIRNIVINEVQYDTTISYGQNEIAKNFEYPTYLVVVLKRFDDTSINQNSVSLLDIFPLENSPTNLTNIPINFKLSDGSFLFKTDTNVATGSITKFRSQDRNSLNINVNGRIQLEQSGYTNQNEITSDYAKGILTRRPFQQTLTEDGKLFLYEPTNNLPIYFIKVSSNSLENPGDSNLDRRFFLNYFSIRSNETGFYLYPTLQTLRNNAIANTTFNQFNIILNTDSLTRFPNDTINNLKIYRVPYDVVLGIRQDIYGVQYATNLQQNASLEVFIYPQQISIVPDISILPIKQEGLINYTLRVFPPSPPDPDDYDWPTPPRIPPPIIYNKVTGLTTLPITSSRRARSKFHRHLIGKTSVGRYEAEKYLNKVTLWTQLWDHEEEIYKADVRKYQLELQEFDRELQEVLDGIKDLTILGNRYLLDTSVGLTGTKFKSSNPAYICLHILYEYYLRIKQFNNFTDMVDTTSFNDWARFCTTNNFKFDAVIDFETSVFALLESISKVGRALLIIQQDKIKVLFAKDQTVPKQYLSANNILSFQSTLEKRNLPDGLKGTYFNKSALYRQDEVSEILNTSQDLAVNVNEVDFFGITEESAVRKHLKYLLKNLITETEIYQVRVSIESIVSELGDLIAIHYNDIDSSMINTKFLKPKKNQAGLITGFVTDELVIPELDLTKTYVMKLMTSSTIIDLPIASFDLEAVQAIDDGINTRKEQIISDHVGNPILKRDRQRLVLNLPVTSYYSAKNFEDSGIVQGNLILIGERNNITKYCLIKEIRYNQDLTCTLDLIEYNADLYSDLIR